MPQPASIPAQSKPKVEYALYIDDSGTKEYADDPKDYGTTGNSRYFVFGGVLMNLTASGIIATAVRNLKRQFFMTDDVEIKSNWLRMPKERDKRYLKKFAITEDKLTGFVQAYYDLIGQADLMLIATVIDKQQARARYGSKAYYAPALAYEFLLQRVVQEIRRPDTVTVIIDDMTGATPKGRQYRLNLERQHERLRNNGSQLQQGLDFSPLLQGIRFVDSARSHQVQMADIISYNVYRQFVMHGEDWEVTPQPSSTLPTYEWFQRIGPKFCMGPNKRVQGYGIVKFPIINRVRWAIG